MSEIQQVAISEILNFFSNSIKSAKVVIDGVEREFPIWQTRFTGNTVRKYVKLGSEERGLITRAALIDVQGREWVVKEYNYQKGQDGFILAFPFRQTVGMITAGEDEFPEVEE
ncbi:hypothetical protein [Cytobacillus firmus]|uniref:hypothetical protein n=1 Tax=Cytobacillus firmus TaxID=1399 RepID=UPI0018CF9F27|nr:hypothetical protein [Cytobacillus firmus]MBG9548358.1 hypothetical protein [Cytobacillus firmus]MBG9600792.1 hypothetical protein [Cytobacillus firmus]MBG9657810.1 hypothetical protein [Cytobacillus firmus]MED1904811.1 hypothetical protein [Cytobacillus firmus]MED1938953.1 hypothetical protein [Cytobacillus firmus]